MTNRPHLGKIKSRSRKEQIEVPAQAVHKAACEAGLGRLKHQFYDPTFIAIPQDLWQDYLDWSMVKNLSYITHRWDCDGFAMGLCAEVGRRLRINAAGLVIDVSGKHAYNALLVRVPDTDTIKVVCVEPQQGRFVKIGEQHSESECYLATEGLVLWA